MDICEHPDTPIDRASDQIEDWWRYLYEHMDHGEGYALRNAFEADWREEVREHSEQIEQARRAEERAAYGREIRVLPNSQLCTDYHDFEYPEAKAELKRRRVLTATDWRLIDKHQLQIGMSELALLCSWGSTEINRTVTSGLVHEQYVYGDTLVYVDNGRVTAFQDTR